MPVWSQKNGELAASTGRDFERAALPLLRAFWPSLIQPRELKGLDIDGVDLLEWSDSNFFPVVVQCKGLYQYERLVSAQLPQIKKSVKSFRNSGLRCVKYLLLHNRTGEDREANQEINRLLDQLVEDGLATSAELWDRQTFLKKCQEKLKEEIAVRVAKRATSLMELNKRFFRFGEVHVDPVPVSSEQWVFRPVGSIERKFIDIEKLSPAQVLGSRKRTKWTLLVGHFGQGKSTFALHAAAIAAERLVYVRASELDSKVGGVGTNRLMQDILRANPLFNELDEASAAELNRLGGTLLRSILSNNKPQFSLVIDGLDESTRYSSAQGMVQLTNELEELRCPIILVTRKEHFHATYGNFKSALSEMTLSDLSVKGGADRRAQVFTLEEWTTSEVSSFLGACHSCAEPEQKKRISSLTEAVLSNAFEKSLAALPRHPLFLQMMVTVVSDGHSIPQHPVDLVESWVEWKIRRDLRSGRPVPWPVTDIDAFVEEVVLAMETVAVGLSRETEGAIQLQDDMTAGELAHLLEKCGHANVDPAIFINVSLLVPTGPRRGKDLRLKFYHRSLQEFFLARRWRHEKPDLALPSEVLYWLDAFGKN